MGKLVPAILMIVGGLILAIAPWVDQLPNLDPIVPPNVDGAWVVVVEETSERNPAVARVSAAADFWKSLEERGVKWRFYDIDSPDAVTYREAAKAVGIPALLVVGPDGKLLASKPLPATPDGIGETVKEATGK